MNIIKNIVSRVLVFGLAIAILGTALTVSGDNNVVQAEKLASVYLTNKATGLTTETSPPTARTAPSNRKNASTVYVTFTDVNTSNVVQNSHIKDANKVVVTVVEPDFNKKIAVKQKNEVGTNADDLFYTGMTPVVQGVANSPVIDVDGDGDLSDEIKLYPVANNGVVSLSSALVFSGGTARAGVWQVVSVANGNSATSSTQPMITIISNTASAADADSNGADNGDEAGGAGALADNDDFYVGYFTSAVNTFEVTAWSTVQLESNASIVSVVETGRNTGVFEAEILVTDTEGHNDGDGVAAADVALSAFPAHSTNVSDTNCAIRNGTTTATTTASEDGRFDRSSGQDADCEFALLSDDVDLFAADADANATSTATAASLILNSGDRLFDHDGDGSVLDSVFALDDANGGLANDDHGANPLTILCNDGSSNTAANCTNGNGGVITMTFSLTTAIDEDGAGSAVPDIYAYVVNNVVDNVKTDSNGDGSINASDVKTGRIGADTFTATADALETTGYNTTGIIDHGINRTPIVEAQANSTITVQYKDLSDNSSATSATTGTKVKATVTVDVDAPSPVISSPTAGSSFKDRQPGFVGSVSDIGAGLDVSTVAMYVDITLDAASDGLTSVVTTVASDDTVAGNDMEGSYLAGAAPIDLQNRYKLFSPTLDNTTTMTDGVTSASWTVTTSKNIPCATNSNDGTSVVKNGSATHSNFARAATDSTCADASNPDTVVDYFATATDLAGNRGFSDGKTTDSDAATGAGAGGKDPYTFNIDEKKPSVDTGNTETGVYYNAGTTSEKTGSLSSIVVAFDDELADAPASAFKVTLDSGVVVTPTAAEIGPKGTDSKGVSYDFRKNVYLTLPSDMSSNDTPKVELVDNVADLAGNTTKVGKISNAVDKIKPIVTMSLSGGSGTGASGTSNDSDSLTKSAMTISITTSEPLGSNPTVEVYAEDYGTGFTTGNAGDSDNDPATGGYDGKETVTDAADANGTAAGEDTGNITLGSALLIDTDKDGSFTDEVFLAVPAAGTANAINSTQLGCLSVKSATSAANSVVVLTNAATNNGTACATIAANAVISITANYIAGASASSKSQLEGNVISTADTSTTYTAKFSGTSFSDLAAQDTKAIVVKATDIAGNQGSVGTRDQSSASVYKFRLDKSAPVLNTDPDGDGTVGQTTTLPRPYVIYEFTDNSDVTVVTAKFGSDDVVSQLATTNNKKYFMVPSADLEVKSHTVTAKGTDLAGNKGSESSYTLKVSARKDYKATILAGWNLMSFPSDPITTSVDSVFSNSGIDQVVGYDAMSKGSPWQVATKDSATGTFSGTLSSISSGNGYWVHSDEFSTQAVSLTGPEGPSASAPPSIESIPLASGWNLVGVTDATKAKTQANAGACYKTNKDYLGEDGGSSITKAYEYDTTNLAWTEIVLATDTACATATDAGSVNIGEAFWVYAKPDANGMLTPIVP